MIIHSFLFQDTEIQAIEVQVHVRLQIPSFQILGLAGPEIQEARERIIAAFASNAIEFPKKKVIVNLAPSDIKKSGTGHDLAMAIGIISVNHVIGGKNDSNAKWFAWGALGLDGKIQSCGKTASLLDLLCKDDQHKILYLSAEDAADLLELEEWRKEKKLRSLQNTDIRVIRTLKEVIEPPTETMALPKRTRRQSTPELLPLLPTQERVLDLSIIGRHHSLILGPKGVGKSQMLEWYRWLTPESDPGKSWRRFLYEDNARNRVPLNRVFPLRSVHAQVKPAHLLGSWTNKGFRAGELSLAHGGILIADEFLEWHRDAKECLREPLQNKRTTITRVQGTSEIECDFQLIATGNLCPCGGLPERFGQKTNSYPCRCSPIKVLEYLQKISGPIADRIDLITIFHQEPDPKKVDFNGVISMEKIEEKKSRLMRIREFALEKFGAIPGELPVRWLETNLPSNRMIEHALTGNRLSLRSRHKVLRLARSIQALEMSSELKVDHVMEALGYRLPDRFT
jgi:magnesium chelatase family protein